MDVERVNQGRWIPAIEGMHDVWQDRSYTLYRYAGADEKRELEKFIDHTMDAVSELINDLKLQFNSVKTDIECEQRSKLNEYYSKPWYVRLLTRKPATPAGAMMTNDTIDYLESELNKTKIFFKDLDQIESQLRNYDNCESIFFLELKSDLIDKCHEYQAFIN